MWLAIRVWAGIDTRCLRHARADQMSIPIAIRPARMDDVNLILNSWLKSYRNAPAVTTVPNDIYYSAEHGHKGYILRLLDEGDTHVACDPDDQEICYGWASSSETENLPPIVNYVYVKQAYRRQHIASALLGHVGVLPAAPFWASHMTPVARAIAPNAVFNPYIALFERELVSYTESN